MIEKTKFYYELLKAKDKDEVALIKVINKIMPIIDNLSKDDMGQADEDLRSVLIEYAIEIVKKEDFAEKLLKN